MASQHCSENQVWAIVPAKRFSQAKSRLAAVLTPSERARLARAMLHDVMTVLSSVEELAGILVVSCDPAVAEAVRPFGAEILNDVLETGVNDAVRAGLNALSSQRMAGAMIVPGDVPFATAAEVRDVLRAMKDRAVVLAPALRDGGTNCLAMTYPYAIQPCFGDGSFSGHLTAARRVDASYEICHLDSLGHDIDCPDDLVAAPRRSESRTSDLLDELNLVQARVGRPVLQSLGGQL
jgi:2-phospho-L-lactate/phosphoenolpyruvate guanylyltransferase